LIIIGEKINSSINAVASAIAKADKQFIQQLAIDQVKAGVDYLDINAGTFLDREADLLAWLVAIIQEVIDDIPLCIDSPNPIALKKALAVTDRKAIINSITLETLRYSGIVPLIREYKSAVIALCIEDSRIPSRAEHRLEIACRLVDKLTAEGMETGDIYIDVMAQPVGIDSMSGKVALDAVRAIRQCIPEVHVCCGLSNVSFGLPKRRILNQAFAGALLTAGIDTLFIDPFDKRLMSLLSAAQAILGQDRYCSNYLKDYRSGKLT